MSPDKLIKKGNDPSKITSQIDFFHELKYLSRFLWAFNNKAFYTVLCVHKTKVDNFIDQPRKKKRKKH